MTVSATGGTQISTRLLVSPSHLEYGTVFPEEVLFQSVFIRLSNSFLKNNGLDAVNYKIRQRIKPRSSRDASYCQDHPSDLTRCYPTLCPYLSKEPDGTPVNDTGVAAFHDPNASSSIAVGRLSKSDNDLKDSWVIDLHVPCFKGQCAQDDIVPKEYEADPSLEGEFFGCDLVILVDEEQKGTIGFWKNWDSHDTYTQEQINNWLAAINGASGWLVSEAGYSADATGMVSLIQSSLGCNGSTRACAKKKFLAQYLVTRLNVESQRKPLTNPYPVSSGQRTYLGLTNPDSLSDIIASIEGKLPDNGTNPTRAQFILMHGLCNTINNTGL
jgi:hypothetical protein